MIPYQIYKVGQNNVLGLDLLWCSPPRQFTATHCESVQDYGRPSSPKIQGCQIDQQIQSWSKDRLQDSIAYRGMAWPNYRRFSFPS